jgi:hypothetical protein
MDTKVLALSISITGGQSGETDGCSEFYGTYRYRAQGESSWTTIASTTDANTWNVADTHVAASKASNYKSLVENMLITVPASATFVEIEASIREYDPSVFDADEDLGTAVFSIPIRPVYGKMFTQGNASSGTITHSITLESR